MTYTYAVLEVSRRTYEEIRSRLANAGYPHALTGGEIDMHGLAIALEYHEPTCPHGENLYRCDACQSAAKNYE